MPFTASILPNGKNQFIDINGKPLVGGTVAFYEPDTLVPKDTWQDSDQTILNTNPIVLDSRGQAVIYGNGIYRQRVKDSLGNLIWDELTSSPYTPANPPPGVTSFYDFPVFMETPLDGEIFPIYNCVRALELEANLNGGVFTIDPNHLPTSDITITLLKNNSLIGTLVFETDGTLVITFSINITFAAEDQFSIVWPSPQDATAKNIALTFVFSVL